MLEAVIEWGDDPQLAYWRLAEFLDGFSREEQAFTAVARGVARMALRLDDRERLARATDGYLQATIGSSGPISSIRRRWFAALAADRDGVDVEAAAGELYAVGYRLLAAYAFADAAILAARTGRVSNANERAMAIAAEIGLHPSLGPLPETRWLVPQPSVRG